MKIVRGVKEMLNKWFIGIVLTLMITGCNTATNQSDKVNDGGEPNVEEEEEVNLTFDLIISDAEDKEDNVTEFILKLTNNSSKDAALEFSSGQQFEIIVNDATGNEVYRFSADRVFTQAFQTLIIPAGESKEWKDVWTHDENVVTGTYEVSATIKALTVNEEVIEPISKTTTITIEKQMPVTIPDNNAFQNMDKVGNGLVFTVNGEARVYEGVFQYEVIEAGNVVQSGVETVPEGAPTWSPFSLYFDLTNVVSGTNNIVLELFVYSAKDGSKIDVVTIPIQ
jgi:hypothetical protein